MSAKHQKAKCAANTQRNRSKSIARHTRDNEKRGNNAPIMLACLSGTRMLPVLDLNGYGGPESVRSQVKPSRASVIFADRKGHQARIARFHNCVAEAFNQAVNS